ncbi:lipocalin family protein [Chryseobacterium indologenes]|uniref:lipocalin family protein n=1 Tax=Chryseobacterium indologenes TaxID=253 RepID=UPI0003E05F7D|nr:lipocalin family protein [Chryseobacterium indologenes]QPQ50399.1 lipocalin family protein [Chryseobacterium indologenes]GAE66521.1 hypothetical protein CIN01S_16_01020 [Chryseobacterium indologenes NBRC 14944]SFK47634.1 Lipocalin-like domain-containing protein [Chryseobacterium indologenes]SUX53035.1 Uncharacterised protein [Chryseobacterium indologenes]
MKKLFLSFAVFSAIVSCSSDNDNDEQKASIIGKWKVSKAEIITPGTNKTTIILPEGCEVENTLEFDGVNQIAMTYEQKNDACVPKANSLKYNYDKPSHVLYYNFENGGQYSYKVTTLTQTDLIIEDDKYVVDSSTGEAKTYKRYYKKVK